MIAHRTVDALVLSVRFDGRVVRVVKPDDYVWPSVYVMGGRLMRHVEPDGWVRSYR